ncbi:Hypothetical predicted protein [Podarcis lilfordi]|uniref:Uncharacterized protein n=1 Tax=Podarcis lilfordi TaxID=74358 RepID=A0AA35K0Z4_9SAUR|nr:Hypothetical predicted protein [Podarcis lilfordi]
MQVGFLSTSKFFDDREFILNIEALESTNSEPHFSFSLGFADSAKCFPDWEERTEFRLSQRPPPCPPPPPWPPPLDPSLREQKRRSNRRRP